MYRLDLNGCCLGQLVLLILLFSLCSRFFGPWGSLVLVPFLFIWINKWLLMRTVSQTRERIVRSQHEIFELIFQSLGKFAKADGVVTRDEADFAKRFLDHIATDFDLRVRLRHAFSAGIKSPVAFPEMVAAITRLPSWGVMSAANLMYLYCSMSIADGHCSEIEREYLLQAERILGVPGYTASFFAQMGYGGGSGAAAGMSSDDDMPLEECYQVLGIDASASDHDVKRAWHRKVLEFHPDKVQGQGKDGDALQFAHQQTLKVNRAYERIRRERGME